MMMKNNKVFKSFLSHQYKSPDINLYFFNIFKDIAEVQFEVDENKGDTNVSRLQKMIRGADAFIGIYPFRGTIEEAKSPSELRKESRYFRLELDMAIRSGKPAIIFYDKRYKDLINPPAGILNCAFDFEEVTGSGGSPSGFRFKKIFSEFCDQVIHNKTYNDSLNNRERNKVGLFISEDKDLYNEKYKNEIKALLAANNFADLEIVNGPFKLDGRFFELLADMDLAIIDYNSYMANCGLPAFLHGRFIPTIRTKHVSTTDDGANLPLEDFLFGGVEVGYNKDIVIWSDIASLIAGLNSNIEAINANVKRINTYPEAHDYFISAQLKEEAVFVSYSGKDLEIARELVTILKMHFQKVFDYRDGQSIEPGRPWLAEIFENLAKSAIGINLLSASYIDSGNCQHEAQKMVETYDGGKMKLYPVKLYKGPLKMPSYFDHIQYLRYYEYGNDLDKLVKAIIKVIYKK